MLSGTHDPNYQTLAGVNPNVFGGDKAAGAAQPNADGPPPPAVGGMAGMCCGYSLFSVTSGV